MDKPYVSLENLKTFWSVVKQYIDNSSWGGGLSDLMDQIEAKYTKPDGGIPKSDLSSEIIDSIGNASFVQSDSIVDAPEPSEYYATKTYVDNVIGDISSVLDNIIGGN